MRGDKLVLVLVLALSLTACRAEEKEQVLLETIEVDEAQDKGEKEPSKDVSQDMIFVYVCGAVQKAGVYQLPKGSRVYEALQMAGGFTDSAAVTQVNQAEVLEDESCIYVPTVEEWQASGENTYGQSGEKRKVNLNTATREELMTLTGVGESKANQIIQYREEHGRFRRIEDIMQISGIKEGLFEKIKENITV